MNAYQIGKIEGRWSNFLPPIQGGNFRTREEIEQAQNEDTDGSSTDCQSAASSPNLSPVLDPREREGINRRHRGEISSASSVSSVDISKERPKPKISHLDARTRYEISLDLSKYPSLELAVQDEIVLKYRALKARIEAEGLYNCPYTSYLFEFLRYLTFFSLFCYSLMNGWYVASAISLGAFWHQIMFLGHDAGHIGITHHYTTDSVIGMITAAYMGGLSICWWKQNHNVHHVVTNSPEHDPDIEHMPFFAISHRFLNSLFSTYYKRVMEYDAFAKFTIRYQRYLYYPILLFGRFNLYRLSIAYLFLGQGPRKGPAWWHRYFEITGQFFFWYWFGYLTVYRSIPSWSDRVAFVLVSHMVTMPLHVQITLSHFAMSTADLGTRESFPQKMLRTTMDVDCPQWLDFIHGGLQFQAIHHLYPRIPRHNLRTTQKLVQEFCDEVKIPYALYGFVEGNRAVLGRLGEVGQQAAILAQCQRALAEKGDFSLH